MKENKAKADSTRELAHVLGLLESTGFPKNIDTTIEKWQTRLYLLEYRVKNAPKKKTSSRKPVSKSSKSTTAATIKSKQNAATKPRLNKKQ